MTEHEKAAFMLGIIFSAMLVISVAIMAVLFEHITITWIP